MRNPAHSPQTSVDSLEPRTLLSGGSARSVVAAVAARAEPVAAAAQVEHLGTLADHFSRHDPRDVSFLAGGVIATEAPFNPAGHDRHEAGPAGQRGLDQEDEVEAADTASGSSLSSDNFTSALTSSASIGPSFSFFNQSTGENHTSSSSSSLFNTGSNIATSSISSLVSTTINSAGGGVPNLVPGGPAGGFVGGGQVVPTPPPSTTMGQAAVPTAGQAASGGLASNPLSVTGLEVNGVPLVSGLPVTWFSGVSGERASMLDEKFPDRKDAKPSLFGDERDNLIALGQAEARDGTLRGTADPQGSPPQDEVVAGASVEPDVQKENPKKRALAFYNAALDHLNSLKTQYDQARTSLQNAEMAFTTAKDAFVKAGGITLLVPATVLKKFKLSEFNNIESRAKVVFEAEFEIPASIAEGTDTFLMLASLRHTLRTSALALVKAKSKEALLEHRLNLSKAITRELENSILTVFGGIGVVPKSR
jgi:hypothetical protein